MPRAVRIAMLYAGHAPSLVLDITTVDRVGWKQFSTEASGPTSQDRGDMPAGRWQATLIRGLVYGLVTQGADFDKTQLSELLFADGKDPWPRPPPPPPPPYQALGVSTFNTRFGQFLQEGGIGSLHPPIVEETRGIIRIRPAPDDPAPERGDSDDGESTTAPRGAPRRS